MNWDAIGAVGEILGALAVVATLAYLAIQMKQNSASLRIAAILSVALRRSVQGTVQSDSETSASVETTSRCRRPRADHLAQSCVSVVIFSRLCVPSDQFQSSQQ